VQYAFVRVEGVHAIIVTDREGVPLLQGTSYIASSVVYASVNKEVTFEASCASCHLLANNTSALKSIEYS